MFALAVNGIANADSCFACMFAILWLRFDVSYVFVLFWALAFLVQKEKKFLCLAQNWYVEAMQALDIKHNPIEMQTNKRSRHQHLLWWVKRRNTNMATSTKEWRMNYEIFFFSLINRNEKWQNEVKIKSILKKWFISYILIINRHAATNAAPAHQIY